VNWCFIPKPVWAVGFALEQTLRDAALAAFSFADFKMASAYCNKNALDCAQLKISVIIVYLPKYNSINHTNQNYYEISTYKQTSNDNIGYNALNALRNLGKLIYAEAVFKFAKLNTGSVASQSVCSWTKLTAHTGFGILYVVLYVLPLILRARCPRSQKVCGQDARVPRKFYS
jgi:hypothetical protein